MISGDILFLDEVPFSASALPSEQPAAATKTRLHQEALEKPKMSPQRRLSLTVDG
jgi:hypothetical protein